MKRIIKGINILITVILILNIVCVFLINIHFASTGLIISTTDELSPEVNNKDIIIYKKKDTYNKNDIIIYNITNKYYIARVERQEEYLTYIKYDDTETPISNADVKGSPIVTLPSYTIYIYILVNIAILIYLIVVILISVKKMYEEEEKKKTAI